MLSIRSITGQRACTGVLKTRLGMEGSLFLFLERLDQLVFNTYADLTVG